MKTKTTITEITHDDLVNLLCTATEGSNWLDCWVLKAIRAQVETADGDCLEDVWAKVLLAGFPIMATDMYAEGETYGSACLATLDEPENEDSSVTYRVTLDRIRGGLQSAIDGTFEGDENAKMWAAECVRHLIEESFDFDINEAEALMQIIMFNEIIYG